MKYKHENLIRDYIADMSQIVQFQYPNSDKWITWPHETFPSFDEACKWRLLPAPKPDVVMLGEFNCDQQCVRVVYSGNPNIRGVFDAVTGKLKSVEKI